MHGCVLLTAANLLLAFPRDATITGSILALHPGCITVAVEARVGPGCKHFGFEF